MSDGKLHSPATTLAFCEKVFTAGENLAAIRQGHQGAVGCRTCQSSFKREGLGRYCLSLQPPQIWEGVRTTKCQQPAALHQGIRTGTSVPISSVIIGRSAACRSSRGQTACHSSAPCRQTISALLLPWEVPFGSNVRLLAFALASSCGSHCQLQQLAATEGCSRSPSHLSTNF